MTVKTFKEMIDKFATAHPELLNKEIVVDGSWIRIGELVRDEEDPSDRYWETYEMVACLPKNVGTM